MKAEEIKHLQVGQALVVYRNLPPFVGRMHPLWERRDWKKLTAQARESELMCGKGTPETEPTVEVTEHETRGISRFFRARRAGSRT